MNPSVAYFRLGDHICFFYRSEKQLIATLVPYVRLGLERNEQCFCIQSAKITRQLSRALQAEGIDVELYVQRGALVFLDPERAYLEGGRFEPGAMTKLLSRSIRKALHSGFSGFRASGDMRWALHRKHGSLRLLEYETLMDGFFPVKPAVGLCAYSTKEFSAAKLRDLLMVHRCALLEDHPTRKQRTLRIHGGKAFGQVQFDQAGNAPFHCEVQQTSGAKRLFRTDAQSLATAIGWVKRRMREQRRGSMSL